MGRLLRRVLKGTGVATAAVGCYVGGSITYANYCASLIDREFVAIADGRQLDRPYTIPKGQRSAQHWTDVLPTLRTGDVVLMMGTGSMSWKITTLGFAWMFYDLDALRYSHIAVVVGPDLWADADTSRAGRERKMLRPLDALKQLTPSALIDLAVLRVATVFDTPIGAEVMRRADAAYTARGRTPDHWRWTTPSPLILEAIDNKDVNGSNVLQPGVTLHDQVQVGYLADRIFGKEGDRWCYNRVAVRRLTGFEWTPERRQKAREFVEANAGRPMDKSPRLMLAMVDPDLHKRDDPRTISCSELVVDFYKAIGVLPNGPAVKPWARFKDGADTGLKGVLRGVAFPSICYAPYHFTTNGMRYKSHYFGFEGRDVAFGPEERVDLDIPATRMPTPIDMAGNYAQTAEATAA